MTDLHLALRWDIVILAVKVGLFGLAVWWFIGVCFQVLENDEPLIDQKKRSWRR